MGTKSRAEASRPSRSRALRWRRRFFAMRSFRVSSCWLGKWFTRWWSASLTFDSGLKRKRAECTDAQYTSQSSPSSGSQISQPRLAQLAVSTSLSKSDLHRKRFHSPFPPGLAIFPVNQATSPQRRDVLHAAHAARDASSGGAFLP